MDLREIGWRLWTGFIWLRITTIGWLLWIRQWAFGFHKMLEISWVAERLLTSHEVLGSMEWVNEFVSWLVDWLASQSVGYNAFLC
jgi:hypothetical protein